MTENDLKLYRKCIRARALAASALEEFEPRIYTPRRQQLSALPLSRAESDRLTPTLERIERLRARIDALDLKIAEAEELLFYVASLLDDATDRDLLVYRYYKGLAPNDTAKAMRVSRKTFYNRRNKILEIIKNITYVITNDVRGAI